MELIFENVEERDEFFMMHVCPSKCGGTDFTGFDCMRRKCIECWEKSGVKYRVKNQPTPDHPVPIEEQKGSITEIVINEPLRPGDRLVKKDGKWCIEKRPESKQVYISTASHLDPVAERMLKNMLNTAYGKNGEYGVEPFIIAGGRSQGKSIMATYSVLGKLDHDYLHNKNWKEAIDIFMDKHDRIKKPQIEKVIFNDPATIVFWKDGTKTVVKCKEGDKFDEEKGLAMAICKKVYGEGYWTGVFKEWVPKESVSKRLYAVGKLMSVAMNESMRRATENLKNLEKALDDIATVKRCETCAYKDLGPGDEPCRSCKGRPEPSNWKPKPSEPLKPCEDCKYADVHEFHEPCRSCKDNSGFEEKEEVLKVCANCKHNNTTSNWPCMCCGALSRDYFEPRIEK